MDTRLAGGCLMFAFVILSLITAGCTTTSPAEPAVSLTPTISSATQEIPLPGDTTPPGPGTEDAVVTANNQFSADMYRELSREAGADSNLFFSPFSISSALAITNEGAKGETADEIRSVLHLPSDTAGVRNGFLRLNTGIGSAGSAYTLRTANALWAEKTHPFLPGYISTAEQYYGARTTSLDFINEPEPSRLTINKWVEDQTEDKIKDLIPAGTIDPITRLVITNAIYFKGDWVKQFDKNKTTDADFRTVSGKTVKVPMMQRTDEEAVFPYAENSDLQVLSMPYEHGSGKQLSMVVLLPKKDNISVAGAALDPDLLSTLRESVVSRQVKVYFPKFRLETKYEGLAKTLASMGMPTAFTADADFSGMDGTKDLLISDVIHQAYVDVNEEGTEAAAATAVVMKLAAAPAGENSVPVFRADHPFVFAIVDDETGAVLFVGRIADPSPA